MLRVSLLRSSYFRRLYLTFLAFFLTISTLILIVVYTQLSSSVKQREWQSIREKLTLLEPSAREVFSRRDYSSGGKNIFSDHHRLQHIRFTLLTPHGEIIADSQNLPETIVDGWSFPEVQKALDDGLWGTDERVVEVFGKNTMVVAMALRDLREPSAAEPAKKKVIGVLRGEMPVSHIEALTHNISTAVFWMAVLCALLAFAFGYYIARVHASPISQMAQVSRAIRAGDYGKKVSQQLKRRDELGQLGTSLNDLSQTILSNIRSLSLERAQLKSMLACMQEGIISLSDEGVILFCNRAAYQHLNFSPGSDVRNQNIKEVETLKPLVPIWESVIKDQRFEMRELTLSSSPSSLIHQGEGGGDRGLDQGEESHRRGDGAYDRKKRNQGTTDTFTGESLSIEEQRIQGSEEETDEESREEKHLQIYATFYESRVERHTSAHHTGVMMVLDNLSEVKKLQKMRRQFFAHVSHELKTPLTSIQGYIETLLDGAHKDPEVRERFLKKIDTNTQRLLSLVRDLLSVNKMDSTAFSISPRPLQWLPVIKKIAESYEHRLRKRGITLEILPRDGSILVSGDYESMYTIADNLLSNAIRYSKEQSQIKIWWNKDGAHQYLHITDTGVGIPAEHQSRIFDRFYRVDKARSRAEGGTGLGLSIVKMLCERQGGQVSVISEEGIGSTFSVRLQRVF